MVPSGGYEPVAAFMSVKYEQDATSAELLRNLTPELRWHFTARINKEHSVHLTGESNMPSNASAFQHVLADAVARISEIWAAGYLKTPPLYHACIP